MKRKSNKIRKLERNRYSIVTDNLDTCYLCGRRKDNLHEVFFGEKHRKLSMQYGLVIPLCAACHDKIHNDIQIDLEMKKRLEGAFIEVYKCDVETFINIFHKNYIKKN